MAGLGAAQLQAIRDRFPPPPRIFCETGTFWGERAALAARLFAEVHTVELSVPLAAAAAARFPDLGIDFVQGDSREVVRRWAADFTEPVCWYLDAHWFDLNRTKTREGAAKAAANPVAGAEAPFPLWDELTVIAARPYADLIIVDDVRDFGTEQPVPLWREVSLQRIADYFPERRLATTLGDQALVYR